MADPAPHPHAIAAGASLAATSGGVGLLFNATAGTVTGVSVIPDGQGAVPITSLPLFPTSSPRGSSVMAGCSFPIPAGGNFTLKIHFDSGEVVTGSISSASTANPALYVITFLNGFVVVAPNGRATGLDFSSGAALDAMVVNFRSRP